METATQKKFASTRRTGQYDGMSPGDIAINCKTNYSRTVKLKTEKAAKAGGITTAYIRGVWKQAVIELLDEQPDLLLSPNMTNADAGILRRQMAALFTCQDRAKQFLYDVVMLWDRYIPLFDWRTRNKIPGVPTASFIAYNLKYFQQYSQDARRAETSNQVKLDKAKEKADAKRNEKQAKILRNRIDELEDEVLRLRKEETNKQCQGDNTLRRVRRQGEAYKQEARDWEKRYRRVRRVAKKKGVDIDTELDNDLNDDTPLPEWR